MGWSINGWRLNAQMSENRIESINYARSVEALALENTDLVATQFELKRQIENTKKSVIEKEVIKYVQNPGSGGCELNDDFVRIDTQAAGGMPKDGTPSTGTDDTPPRFTDVDLIQVLTDRSEICRNEISKLTSLQEYVRGQFEVLNKN